MQKKYLTSFEYNEPNISQRPSHIRHSRGTAHKGHHDCLHSLNQGHPIHQARPPLCEHYSSFFAIYAGPTLLSSFVVPLGPFACELAPKPLRDAGPFPLQHSRGGKERIPLLYTRTYLLLVLDRIDVRAGWKIRKSYSGQDVYLSQIASTRTTMLREPECMTKSYVWGRHCLKSLSLLFFVLKVISHPLKPFFSLNDAVQCRCLE